MTKLLLYVLFGWYAPQPSAPLPPAPPEFRQIVVEFGCRQTLSIVGQFNADNVAEAIAMPRTCNIDRRTVDLHDAGVIFISKPIVLHSKGEYLTVQDGTFYWTGISSED